MTSLNSLEGNAICYASWNVKGLNKLEKRARVLSHLKHLQVDIAFISESHLANKDHLVIRKDWVGQIFHSNFTQKSRGAAILINKKIQFNPSYVNADPFGRYVVVTGNLLGVPVTLASLYAPNSDDENFFTTFFSSLPDLNKYYLIAGGDFNCVLNPSLDRSIASSQPLTRSAKCIKAFLSTYKIMDPWRFKNPSDRTYSFFSPVHQSFSRIDYFLVDCKLLPLIQECKYQAIVISDHAPHVMKMLFTKPIRTRTWRFNNVLLSDESFSAFIKTQIEYFMSINDTSEISRGILWESLKCFIRGQIIYYSSTENKRRRERITNITDQIIELDSRYSIMPSPDLAEQRLALQTEFDLLSTRDTAQQLLRSRHRSYEYGEKPGKLLAWQIRQSAASKMITEINTSNGKTSLDPREINTAFKQYYSQLYVSESMVDTTQVESFFSKLPIPQVSNENKAMLEEPFSIEELNNSFTCMQSSKAPGPDGFTLEFYRAFSGQISALLLDVFNESFSGADKSLPPTFYMASISLILKQDKDPLEPGSYRPISLLNVDTKLLAKTLALRLERVLPSVISEDQTGFIKNRFLFSNIRRLFNIIYTPSPDPTIPEILISMDAEKAFDRVEWIFLFTAMRKFGFGERFISWVKLLYKAPQAYILTNNLRSDPFTLHRGTRQGCPLSPLLFALVIEPLAIVLRSSGQFQGVHRGSREQRVSLYADDLLLYAQSPAESIPHILSLLKEFGRVSGYKLNFSKSELFPINLAAQSISYSQFPFKLVQGSFKHLGVMVNRTYSDLYKLNFKTLLERTVRDLGRWSHLPLTLAGKVNIVKMNVLPRFMFLFQCIPIVLNKSFFGHLDSEISKFVWNKRKPRIRRAFLQRPKCVGGLGLPNFQNYYWACNIRNLSFWNRYKVSDDRPAWLHIEEDSCRPTSLGALLFSPLPISHEYTHHNPVVDHSLRIWAKIRHSLGWLRGSLLAPLSPNQHFNPSLESNTFQRWSGNGISRMRDLYIDGLFPTFDQLCKRFNLPPSHFFAYLQIRSYIQSNTVTFPNTPEPMQLNVLFSVNPTTSGVISFIYNHLAAYAEITLDHIKNAWEEDLGLELSTDQWKNAQRNVHTSSICARHGLIQLKVLHRAHLSKVKICKMYPDSDPLCDRCKTLPATLAHMFWSCPKLSQYWTSIFKTLSDCFGHVLDPDPVLAIFGVAGENSPLRGSNKVVARFTTLLARRLILLNWKQANPPSHTMWRRDAMQHLALEKLRFTLRGSEESFHRTWRSFIEVVAG